MPDSNTQRKDLKGSTTPMEGETTPLIADDSSNEYGTVTENGNLRQGLHSRHVYLVGLAGSIGTGLFLNIGLGLAASGPLGSILAYGITGLAGYIVVAGIGEMGALVPQNGAIVKYSEYFVDPALSFATGWNAAYGWLISPPAEITAATIFVKFWVTTHDAFWITLFLVIVMATAFSFVRAFGEIEYANSMLKIALIIFFQIMAIIITCGANEENETIGFKYWSSPGPFVQYLGIPGGLGRFLGIWTCARSAFFAYSGIEAITVSAGEIRNPRRVIPATVKQTFIQIFVFYVLTLLMVSLVIPSNDPHLLQSTGNISQSPFVIAANRAGYKALPSIINAVALITAWSGANQGVLRGSRYLYGMATTGHAPQMFAKVSRFGVPYMAVALQGLFAAMAYFSISSSASAIFGWLQSLGALSTVINWLITCVTYLRFYYGCQAQGINRKEMLPWTAPFQPYATWITLVLLVVILAAGDPSFVASGKFVFQDFVTAYINILLVLMLYFGYKFWHKTKTTPLSEIPIKDLIELAEADPDYKPNRQTT